MADTNDLSWQNKLKLSSFRLMYKG